MLIPPAPHHGVPPAPPAHRWPGPADASARTQRPPRPRSSGAFAAFGASGMPSGFAGAMAFFAVALGVASAFVVVVHERQRGAPRAAATASPTGPGAAVQPAATPQPQPQPGATPQAAAEMAPACTPGESRVVVRGARVATGVEVARHAGRVAVAVTTGPREARAFEVDPASLRPRGAARWTTAREVRRALPLFGTDDLLDVTADDGADARRGAAIDADTYAIVYRRGGVVWVETTRGGAVADGPVALSRPGRRVGVPSVVVTPRARDVVVTWAERAASGTEHAPAAWGVRWTRWTPGQLPGTARVLDAPNAIAPSVSELPGGGGLVLAWTQGTGRSHEIRAAVLDERGELRGDATHDAVLLSSPGSNAGQQQLALEPDGHGVVFFLASQADGRFALVARALSCTAH